MAFDTPLRTDWHFIPKPTRKGLQLKEMNDEQHGGRALAVASALSAAGYGKATKIMQLEGILHELEKQRTTTPRSRSSTLLLHVVRTARGRRSMGVERRGASPVAQLVIDHNQVVSSTPTFSANPGVLMADYGPQFPKGLRVLAKEEELAFELLRSLSPDRPTVAVVAEKAPSDIRNAGSASPPVSPAAGLAASEMTEAQATILRSLIEQYAHDMPDDVARQRLAAIEKEGYSGIRFAWAGPDKPGVGHDYRIQGPTFLIEFNNTQPDSAGNLANHIHSVWHNLAGNFDIPTKSHNGGRQNAGAALTSEARSSSTPGNCRLRGHPARRLAASRTRRRPVGRPSLRSSSYSCPA